MTDLANENWLPIPGHEGLYSVSNLGRVRSEARTVERRKGGALIVPERILKPSPDGHGYFRVSLSRAGRAIQRFIHQLVMEAFVGPCPDGQEVRHLNGDPAINRLDNLAYGTRLDNMQDARAHGTIPVLERRPGAKLTREDARAIFASLDTTAALAERFGVVPGVIRQIKLRETWASVTADLPDAEWASREKLPPDQLAIALDRAIPRAEAATKLDISISRVKYLRKTRREAV